MSSIHTNTNTRKGRQHRSLRVVDRATCLSRDFILTERKPLEAAFVKINK